MTAPQGTTSSPTVAQQNPPQSPPASSLPTSPTPPVVIPEPDSKLEQLTAEWWALKPYVEELQERLTGLSKAIKQETAAAAPPGSTEVVLRSPYLPTPYRLHQVETWRLDTAKLKAADPATYARYAKKSASWRLDAVK